MTMRRPLRQVPIHNLRPNHGTWTPPAVLSFDTETESYMDGEDEVMVIRLWCARFTDRRKQRKKALTDQSDDGTFGEDLAVWVHKLCKARRTVWGYAHNLGFDLCTSQLVEHLIDMGWTVTDFAVNSSAPFVRLRHKDSTLTLSDSWSWFQARLEDVADALGKVKPKLPEHYDDRSKWLERCRADVDILHTAMLTLMEWWDKNGLGNWTLTGSASGWNAMRHIPTPRDILIRPDDTECDHDRRAIYGGRRNIWQSGRRDNGHFAEIDIFKAYTSVCRYFPLPVGRQCTFTSLPITHKWLDCNRWGVIAECTVSTDIPRVPVRIANSVWYPVGRFNTVLAGPDIRELRDNGCLESVGAGWLHQLGHALRPWANWCLASLADETGAVPEVARMVHRVWARSAIGKWAQRGFQVIQLGPSPNEGWNHEEAWHHRKGVPASIVDFAGTRYQVAAVNQSDNAYPAILAFVESYVRVAIGRAISVVGDADMVSCDTDGYIANARGIHTLGDVNDAIAPLAVRVKRHYTKVHIIGPQHMQLDNEQRRAGIPSSAKPRPDGKLHAQTWPKLAWQLSNGRAGAYVRPHQTYRVAATYAPGWLLSDGSVVPVEMRVGAHGGNEVVPWPQTRYAARGATLGPEQNRHLKRWADG